MQKFKNVFDEIRNNPNFSPENSVEWFRKRVQTLGLKPGDPRLLRDRTNIVQKVIPGFVYLFAYEAKTETLPFYDMFPLSFVFSLERDGFYGINFHYLAPKLRFALYDKMVVNLSNNKMDETTKIRANWALLSNFSKFPMVKPAVKRYLYTQRQSNFLRIPITDVKTALMLPVENFVGKNKQQVWANSLKIIRTA